MHVYAEGNKTHRKNRALCSAKTVDKISSQPNEINPNPASQRESSSRVVRQLQLARHQFSARQDRIAEHAPSRTVHAQTPHPRNPPHTRLPDASVPPPAHSTQTPAAQPTLALSNNTYSDGSESRKRIHFDVTVPAGLNARYYALVNKIKGMAVDARGHSFYVTMDQISVPYYFTNWVVDSPDHDPVYNSNGAIRWAYTPTDNGFYTTDDPGPARSSEPNSLWDLCFRTELHRLIDVPADYSASLPAPLDVKYWQYYVRVDQTGRFSHQRPRGESDRCANQ